MLKNPATSPDDAGFFCVMIRLSCYENVNKNMCYLYICTYKPAGYSFFTQLVL